MSKLFNVQLAIFRPLWRRVALVVFCFAWAALEYALGHQGWSLFFIGIGSYLSHQFFIAFNPPEDPAEDRP